MNGPFLAALVALAFISFAGAWMLPLAFSLHPAAHVHLALAAGAMPLILGAISHFVPVLTRSRPPHAGFKLVPALAAVAGLLIFAHFAGNAGRPAYPVAAALLGIGACGSLALWVASRGRAALGSPHPGLYWYLAALACLVLGLVAVPAMAAWPAHSLPLRRFHLHLNTLGFIGLTAFGTLQVLLPTAAGRPDAGAAGRLRRDLPISLAATLAVAAGSAWLPLLAWLGLLLWLVPVSRLMGAWFAAYRQEILAPHGASPLLAGALAGFGAALAAGGLHASGWAGPVGGAHLYVFAFLFPLVSGAAGQLLPLWLRPGAQAPWQAQARKRLTAGAGGRSLLFFAAGLMAVAGVRWGMFLALAGLAPFLAQAGWELLRLRDKT